MKNLSSNNFLVLAFYHLIPIRDIDQEVFLQKEFTHNKDITCRIYVADNGINGQMSAYKEDAYQYMEWMQNRQEFKDLTFQIDYWHEHTFPRKQIKKRRELVALGKGLDLSKRGTPLSPKEWRHMLEKEKRALLIDVRNSYEYDVGHFEGAENSGCDTFKDFNLHAEKLVERFPEQKPPIMMYCTGGIRCEFYSALLKNQGFNEVYQLEGGVINYGIEEGSMHWKGKLFVFDDRMTVPISQEESKKVGQCLFCSQLIDHYYNCANMDCNRLFISCRDCLSTLRGCCREECMNSLRKRPYDHQNPHKPFKKYYHYFGYKKLSK